MDPAKRLKAMDGVLTALKGLDAADQSLVIELTARNLGIGAPAGLRLDPGAPPAPATGNLPAGTTAKAFMAQKKPLTDVNRMVALAYFLTHHKATTRFKTKDLTTLASDEAAQPKFSNAAMAVNNAAKAKLLAAAGKGQKQITARGEALIEAMPDKERMEAALSEYPAARRRAKGKRTAKKST